MRSISSLENETGSIHRNPLNELETFGVKIVDLLISILLINGDPNKILNVLCLLCEMYFLRDTSNGK